MPEYGPLRYPDRNLQISVTISTLKLQHNTSTPVLARRCCVILLLNIFLDGLLVLPLHRLVLVITRKCVQAMDLGYCM
ncbi:hypothetical protein BT69DRAFT_1277382, partial [Atractiella rhizophila]